jgi:uncharacterized protein with PIN domain
VRSLMTAHNGQVHFRFYEELNDFLPPARRKRDFAVPYNRASVKDMIESVGVPHTEVDLILANGVSVDFSYLVRPGDRISVYPEFESFDIAGLTRLRPEPLRQPRFVLDTHLGKLARYLRLLGFDVLYSNTYSDAELAAISADGDKRILLTRDHGLLKRVQVTHGYFVRETAPEKQVLEVLRRFDLKRRVRPFTRCLQCNGELRRAPVEEIADRVPPGVVRDFDVFSVCPDCGRVYWAGSHYDRLRGIVDHLLDEEM